MIVEWAASRADNVVKDCCAGWCTSAVCDDPSGIGQHNWRVPRAALPAVEMLSLLDMSGVATSQARANPANRGGCKRPVLHVGWLSSQQQGVADAPQPARLVIH